MLEQERIHVHNFSLLFEQMCSIVAIADTQNAEETLRQLILQSLVVRSNEKFQNSIQLKQVIDNIFGLHIPEYQIQSGLDWLIDHEYVQQNPNSNLILPPQVRSDLQKRIEEAKNLENKVKQEWFNGISVSFPLLPIDQAWIALQSYLTKAFRRHGMQTVALLDPSIDAASEHSESLSILLDNVLFENFPPDQHTMAHEAITNFLAAVGSHPERTIYIAQLADGAFNYFSLTVAPDIAQQFKKRLNQLILFLDTNFLFGILDLHENPFVEVSNELIRVTEKNKLPFKLRYHSATQKELGSTIASQVEILRTRRWTQAASRAACTSPELSGIELKYHKMNSANKLDVDAFLKLYNHTDFLLKNKGIEVFRTNEDRLYERANLLNEYQEFLNARGKFKPYEAIDHDTTVLDAVRKIRTKAKSSLDAGALLITCDYHLYKFDWETSRAKGHLASVVLPNLFLQILRPFIPSDSDFDRSFAETFAIPEFRTIGNGGASKARSKMLSYLMLYTPFPEEAAKEMLSNSLLIDELRNAEGNEQFREYVDSALASTNASLLEDKIALEKQLEKERIEKETNEASIKQERIKYEEQIAQAKQASEKQKKELETLQKKSATLEQKNSQMKSLEQKRADEKKQAQLIIKKTKQEKEEAEKLINQEKLNRKTAERNSRINAIIASTTLSFVLVILFEVLIHDLNWSWLLNHPHSYPLQICFILSLCLTIFGAFFPKVRKWCWSGGGIFALLLVVIQLL